MKRFAFVRSHKRVREIKLPDGTRAQLIEEENPFAQFRHTHRHEGNVDALVVPKPLVLPMTLRSR